MFKREEYIRLAQHVVGGADEWEKLDIGSSIKKAALEQISQSTLRRYYDEAHSDILAVEASMSAEEYEMEKRVLAEEWMDKLREKIEPLKIKREPKTGCKLFNLSEAIAKVTAQETPGHKEFVEDYTDRHKQGILSSMRAYATCKEAALRADPKSLWSTLWYEGEVCCLFADSNLGKSIYAVQIASHIALEHKVLYFDFELSDKQFQLRYTDDDGVIYHFPNNLVRVEIDQDAAGVSFGESFEDIIIRDIEEMATITGAKILIIDNLTYLCSASEKGDAAGNLMLRLMSLKRTHNLSILIIAHTPKRTLVSPITQNDLAGSKKLFNFFDSVFAIGKSAKDDNVRYIKQLKIRHGVNEYSDDNVEVCTIDKVDGFLRFVSMGRSSEREHLKEVTDATDKELKDRVLGLHSGGMSTREIALELQISHSKAYRIIKSA